jgi:excisionase family DNA binding protein
MSDLYTVKQIQGLLKVDRITIYRMLQDGRLNGIKIGHQWRFAKTEVDRFLGISNSEEDQSETSSSLPVHCIQTIQNLFSDISQLSSLVVDIQGNPLTNISYPCAFCTRIVSSPAGREACKESWKAIATECQTKTQVISCHAGLNYAAAPIYDQGKQIGAFITGQYYMVSPDRYEESERVKRLATMYRIPLDSLNEAVLSVQVISAERRSQVETWPRTAAQAVHSILEERTGFINRLQKIADLSQIAYGE